MTLLKSQEAVLSSGLLNSGFSCVLQMPTGSGKTWLAEQAIQDVLTRGSRAIYLTPLRAQAAELTGRWQRLYSNAKVGVFTGDFGIPGIPYPIPFNQANLLVMTPERLDACTRVWRSHWNWIPEVSLIVIDELHLLGDRHRGARLEGAISRFRRLNPFACILGLSATLGNRHELADWLDGVEFYSDWRPIPINWRIVRYRKASEKPGLLIDNVSRNVNTNSKSIIFVQSRRRAEELTKQLQSQGLRATHHHAGLKMNDRHKVEAGFRGNEYNVLVSTSTLEMGVNLPVRQVILYDLQAFDGTEFIPLSTNTVFQRAGRAGRPGLDTEGEALLLAPQWNNQVKQYLLGKFEPIYSQLYNRQAVSEQILAEVASGLCRTVRQLTTAFNQSLAAKQKSLPNIASLVWEMRQAGMLEATLDDGGRIATERLRATRQGHIAVRHFLNPTTVLQFRRALERYSDLTFFDLLILAASTEDCEPILPVDFEELDALADHLSQERSLLLGHSRKELAELLGIDGKRLLAAIKMAQAALDFTRSGEAEDVAEKHNCYPFEIERLRESLDRLLLAMTALFEKTNGDIPSKSLLIQPGDHVPLRERVMVLRQMITAGINEAAATLTLINGIGPKWVKRLYEKGIADIEDLASSEVEDLMMIQRLSPDRARRWITEANEKIRFRSAFSYREDGPPTNVRNHGWAPEVDPYRLRRALDLKITRGEGGSFQITGGLESHVVLTVDGKLICDCQDAAKVSDLPVERQRQCKHVLAVRLHCGDTGLTELALQIKMRPDEVQLNLFNLWFESKWSAAPKRGA